LTHLPTPRSSPAPEATFSQCGSATARWGILDQPEQSLSVLSILLAEMAEQVQHAGVDADALRAESARHQARERGIRRAPGTPVR
jgi:hypothetical protein